MENRLAVYVSDTPFCAKGDGITDDREAIQQAIDYVYSCGGGTVILGGNRTYSVTGIVIRSNIELHFEDGAKLLQTSELGGYVKPVDGGYEPYTPIIGHNFSETIKWSHTWYKNYPFIFAPEGSYDFKITGNGIIRMAEAEPNRLVRCCPIGFFRAYNFEISDITINNYHGYAMMPFTCHHGLIKNVKIFEWSHGNGDGICMMNCQNMRVTECKMYTGDDSVYIFSSYKDPRRSEWWNSDEPQPSVNIEIDHNDLESHHCKAFGMILWGVDCPDLEKIEVRNVYVHDNHFKTLGNWNFNPYTTKTEPHPVTNMVFENNVIDAIETNFFETPVSGLIGFRSMRTLRNGDFKNGKVYWMTEKAEIIRSEKPYASLDSFGMIYQGLYLKANELCAFFVTAQTNGSCRIFVKDSCTGDIVFEKPFSCKETQRIEADFSVPQDGNYYIGVEATEDSSAVVYETEFAGNMDTGTQYNRITKDGGKILFYYD